MRTVRVELGSRSYTIAIGKGLLCEAGTLLSRWGLSGKCLVVSDTAVGRLYGRMVVSSIENAGFKAALLAIPPGEEHKTPAQVAAIVDAMLAHNLDRGSCVVSLGGGVVGDTAGFAAATYMRGIPFVQIPTTLLAQVDAGIGGKVGVNLPQGKNLIGAFHQPAGVLIDPSVLATLDAGQLRSGFAEVIKHAVIRDADYFERLEALREKALALDPAIMEDIIARSCEIKAAVVHQDERESGVRMILNYGHTIGHAIECATGYTAYLHGEAVAIGMAGAAVISRRLGRLADAEKTRITGLIERCGLPVRVRGVSTGAITGALARDKKAHQGKVRFVLPRRIGETEVVEDVPEAVIRATINELCA
ncbi:MAG: 3-dehydroquinate synthase [Candidatus Aureabacteria bacterium]|nr:3-dehydroquinate synthase [Candidatus Auribacterota bacterium]